MEYLIIGAIILLFAGMIWADYTGHETVSGERDPLDADRSEWGMNGKRKY